MSAPGVDAIKAKMLAHVLSRCRKGCRGSRACAQYAALLLEYRAFLRGEEMNNDPTCICGDPASAHKNGHGSCSCGCPTFKLAPAAPCGGCPKCVQYGDSLNCICPCHEDEPLTNYEPEPEGEDT